MGKECDYVQCVSLATEFGVPVRIEYLGKNDTALNIFLFSLGTVKRFSNCGYSTNAVFRFCAIVHCMTVECHRSI